MDRSFLRSLFVFPFVAMLLVIGGSGSRAADGTKALQTFESRSGNFRLQLPGVPQEETVNVGDPSEPQHQLKLGTDQGMYLVSYQDNPNLKNATAEELMKALELGRDNTQKVFQGELLENQTVTLNNVHQGLHFRMTIPSAKGEARCRFYLIHTRLYQLMAIGVPEFANSEQTVKIFDSFQLLP